MIMILCAICIALDILDFEAQSLWL